MTGSKIRERLRDGECVYGTHIVSLMNPVAAAMTAGLPMDFAFICTEHMPIDRTEVSMMCQYYTARGISPVVRVPSSDVTSPASISMMIDGGAQGIVVPYVETVEEVRRAVAATKYRPIKGELMRQVIAGKTRLPDKTVRFLEQFNAENYLIIGIESMAAIDNLELLVSIAGVDGVFLGPHDITVSMGIPEEYENPLFIDTVEDVIKRCRACSVGVGLHTALFRLKDETLRRLIGAGLNWLINGADVTIMRDAMSAQLNRLRQLAGDAPLGDDDNTDTLAGEDVDVPSIRSCIS
jgi:4-hydroxy-2-oxoheptanedioate aldolase